MDKKMVSDAVIKRLPKYYRQILLLSDQGKKKVSSHALAQMLDITASQVRQDFCNFGGFGQQGYGYDVEHLKESLANIIGLNRQYNVIIIGAGNIGRALGGYQGFAKYGFYVKAMFDIAPITDKFNDIPVYKMEELTSFVQQNNIEMAVIATPKNVAQKVADELISCNIKTIWNFAPINLVLPSDVVVENVAMSESLLVLSYRANNKDN